MARKSRIGAEASVLLGHLEQHGDFVKACQSAGIPRSTAYYWREQYPEFAKKCTIAIAIGSRRAHDAEWHPSMEPPVPFDLEAEANRILAEA